MAKIVVVPRNMKSRSAKALAATLTEKLGYKVYRVRPSSVRKRAPIVMQAGTDKFTQLKRFNNDAIPHPEFTNSIDVARDWIVGGAVVVCRRLLRGSEGRGIVIAETVDQLVGAPLYTKYVPKKEEFRVHVYNGQVIDVQMKKKRKGFEDDRNTRVRNLANGYVFCRNEIVEPPQLHEIAVQAVRSLGYKFGAVDIAHNIKRGKLVVLEVNAAPGMQGTTLDNYSNAIIKGIK